MAGWKTLSTEEVYKTPWFKVRRDEVTNQLGQPLTYSVVELHHPSVMIVAINEHQEVLIQRGYRYTLNAEEWSLPAGHSDGQEPLTAAKRELMEEAGLESDDWTPLGKMSLASGVANMIMYVFAARDVRAGAGERDTVEDILEHQFVSVARLREMVADDTFSNAPSLAAILKAQSHNLLGE